jgi:hypothetical protein
MLIAIGTMLLCEIKPRVGLMPTMPLLLAGLKFEPFFLASYLVDFRYQGIIVKNQRHVVFVNLH